MYISDNEISYQFTTSHEWYWLVKTLERNKQLAEEKQVVTSEQPKPKISKTLNLLLSKMK